MEQPSNLHDLDGLAVNNNNHHQNEVSRWFKDEEFYWRSVASYIWLTLLFPLVFLGFIFCVNITILSPFTWITGTNLVTWITGSCSMVFTFSTVATIMFLQIVCVLTTFPHVRALSVHKINHTSKLNFLLFLVSPKQLVNLICFVTSSFIMCSILKRFELKNNQDGKDNLSTKSVFLSFVGPFVGFFYTVMYYSKHDYVAHFPVIQQRRFFRLKKMVSRCFRDSLMLTLKVLQIYYPIFILTGLLPMNILPDFLSYHNSSDVSFFASLWSVCDISLFWTCFSISMVTVLVLHISNLLVQVFNTQIYTFPIVASLTEQQNITLSDAMESNNIFLKHVACLDYFTLSRCKGPRRLKMFDLSSPGNQAHSWNKTSTESLRIIQNMRSQMVEDRARKQHSFDDLKSLPPKTIGSQELFSADYKKVEKYDAEKKLWFKSPSKLLPFTKLSENKATKEKELLAAVPKNPIVETVAANMFEHLQISLWCIEGLCNLVAASLKEDKYGVVQQKLPDVIAELLLLLEACEQFSKTSFNVPSANHSYCVEAAQINNSHATSLKIAVKTGLYTITTAFGYHISAIRLPSDHKKRLCAFLEFAE